MVDTVANTAVHRRIEQQAASRGDDFAYVDETRALTYRELNYRANAVARALLAAGFRRGSVAPVRMERSADLLVTLLGILKAGGAYRWSDAAGDGRVCGADLAAVLAADYQPTPNLPILTRGSDIACMLGDGVLVPHATVAALVRREPTRNVEWAQGTGALDVWVALMTGATVTCTEEPATVAA